MRMLLLRADQRMIIIACIAVNMLLAGQLFFIAIVCVGVVLLCAENVFVTVLTVFSKQAADMMLADQFLFSYISAAHTFLMGMLLLAANQNLFLFSPPVFLFHLVTAICMRMLPDLTFFVGFSGLLM